MDRNRPSRKGRRRRVFLGFFTVVLAIASVGTTVYTLAMFTDITANGSNDFTNGTLDISVSPASAVLTVAGMMPGDTTNGTLTVSNNGSGTLRYALSTAASNVDLLGLRDQLTVVVKTKDTDTAGCANFNGAQQFSGTLAAAFFGDPTPGTQGGERTLAGAASEILCFRATLPPLTGNVFQGAATTATFTFSAEQTANNS